MPDTATVKNETQSIWMVEPEKDKPVKLSEGFQEFQHPIDKPGKYAMVFYSPDHLPKHHVDILVQVFSDMDPSNQVVPIEECVPDPSDPEALQEYFFEYSNFYHSEVLRLSDEFPVLATEWEFPESNVGLPARIRVFAFCQKAMKSTKFHGRLFLNPDWHDESIPQELTPNTDWIYREQTQEDVEMELERHSEERQKAFEEGLIRPFLLLVSMHPAVRGSVGSVLGINVRLTKAKKEMRGDSHKEAWEILTKSRKGLNSVASKTMESLNPVASSQTWFTCLYRALTAVKTTNSARLRKLGNTESLPYCKDSNDGLVPTLELQALKDAREIHRKTFKKADKKAEKLLRPKVDELMEDPQVKEFFGTLKHCGIDDQEVLRFAVEICVLVHYRKWKGEKKSKLPHVNMSIPLKILAFTPKVRKLIDVNDVTGGAGAGSGGSSAASGGAHSGGGASGASGAAASGSGSSGGGGGSGASGGSSGASGGGGASTGGAAAGGGGAVESAASNDKPSGGSSKPDGGDKTGDSGKDSMDQQNKKEMKDKKKDKQAEEQKKINKKHVKAQKAKKKEAKDLEEAAKETREDAEAHRKAKDDDDHTDEQVAGAAAAAVIAEEAGGSSEESDESEDEEDKEYSFTAEEMLHGIQNQLKKGNYAPSGFADKEGLGEKGAKKLVRKGLFVALAPIAPLLIFPYTVGNFVHSQAGANNAALWLVCIQICIQRLVLAARGMNLSEYYEDLAEEYRQARDEGDLGHREKRAAKKAAKKQEKDEDTPYTKLGKRGQKSSEEDEESAEDESE